jgi:hypothetical protein
MKNLAASNIFLVRLICFSAAQMITGAGYEAPQLNVQILSNSVSPT